MKNKMSLLLLAATVTFSACKKNNVTSTDPVGTPAVVPAIIPAVTASDSTILLGNPSNATSNSANYGNYLMREGYYSLSYNRDRAIANWVSWHLGASDMGTTPRQDDFRANPSLPTGWFRVDNISYSSTGFDRGHMCPSSDRNISVPANSSTFLMTNIFPQAPQNNQGVWENLESYCRSLVDLGNELYIITGTYGQGGIATGGLTETIDNSRITVPAMIWKTIVVLPNGANDLTRINTSTRVITVLIPNINSVAPDWRSFRTSVDFVEQETGYDLLNALSTSTQTTIESRIDNL